MQFEELKSDPEDFEDFLKTYINNDKALQFSKDINSHLDSLSPVFDKSFDIDAKMSNYILNIEKLSTNFIPHEDDMATVLEGFTKSITKQVDSNMMKAKHFTVGESLSNYDYSGKLLSPKKSSLNSSYASTKGGKKTSRLNSTKKGKPTNEMPMLKFKNFSDLQYDYNKFNNSSVGTAVLEMHGNNLNQKACECMGFFLKNLYSLDHLVLNFSM